MQGWIKIHRKIQKWEWYKDSKMVHLFIHLLTSANHEENKWQGVTVKRGQSITGRIQLSFDTGISQQSVRTCLKKLVDSKIITIKTTNKYSLVTVLKYDSYQNKEKTNQQLTNKSTNNQPTTNQQLTTNNNVKKEKNEEEVKNIPSESEFLNHALSKIPNIDQFAVTAKYHSWVDNGWKDGYDKPIKSWKHKLNNTLPHLKNNNNGNSKKGLAENERAAVDFASEKFNI